MGQATRTTKLFLDLGNREEGGANSGKRAYLEKTARLLDAARAFYVTYFLAHPDKLEEKGGLFIGGASRRMGAAHLGRIPHCGNQANPSRESTAISDCGSTCGAAGGAEHSCCVSPVSRLLASV